MLEYWRGEDVGSIWTQTTQAASVNASSALRACVAASPAATAAALTQRSGRERVVGDIGVGYSISRIKRGKRCCWHRLEHA